MRIHTLAVGRQTIEKEIAWDKVGMLATIGMTTSEAENVHKLCKFVKSWSGGDKAEILANLESYEKTLTLKRYITADDMEILAECDDQYPRSFRYTQASYMQLANHPNFSKSSQINPLKLASYIYIYISTHTARNASFRELYI